MPEGYNHLSRERMESLSAEERRTLQRTLEYTIDARLAYHRDWDDYWREVKAVIADLKAVGHDLWSHDYDGERRQLWGWDYMRMETAGSLQIEFDQEGCTRTHWRSEDPRLGTTPDDD